MILCALYLTAAVLAIAGIYRIKWSNKQKKSKGKLISGRKISGVSLTGTPTRYLTEVQYTINDIVHEGKIITTDKNIMKCKNDETILLIYVEKNNKVYWAEEKSIENEIIIILLSAVCTFALLLAVVSM